MAAVNLEMLLSLRDNASNKLNNFQKNLNKTKQSAGGLQQAFAGLAAKIGGIFAAGALVKGIVTTSAEFERLQTVLKTVTGSSEEAKQAFAFIQDVAKTLPYSLQETTTAFTKMQSLGITPTRAALVSFANVAAGTGKTLNQFVEAVADAVTGEFERLKEFGIKAKSEGDKVSFTFQGVTKTVGKNSVEIQKYLQGIGEVQFAGATADQAKTFNGLVSNMKDELDKLFNAIGTSGGMDILKDSVILVTDVLKDLRSNLPEITKFFSTDIPDAAKSLFSIFEDTIIEEWAIAVLGFIKKIGSGFYALFTNTKHLAIAFIDATIVGFLEMKHTFAIVAEAMSFAWDTVFTTITNTWNKFLNTFKKGYNATFGNLPGVSKLKIDMAAAAQETKSWADRTKELDAAHQAELRTHEMAIAAWHEDVTVKNKLKKSTEDNSKAISEYERKQIAAAAAAAKLSAAQTKAAADLKELNALMKEGKQITEDMKTPSEKLGDTISNLNMLLEKGAIDWETYSRAVFKAQDDFDTATNNMKEDADELSIFMEEAFKGMQSSVSDFFTDVIERKFTSFKHGLQSLTAAFVRTVNRMVAEWLAAKVLTGGFNLFGYKPPTARAAGGPVSAGTPYLVGEAGPELFVPRFSGNIVNNEDTNTLASGGDNTVNIYITAMDSQDVMRVMENNKRGITELVFGTSTTYNMSRA